MAKQALRVATQSLTIDGVTRLQGVDHATKIDRLI